MKRLLLFTFSLLLILLPVLTFAQSPSTSSSGSINLTPVPTDVTYIVLQAFYGYVDNVLYGNGSQLFGTLFGIFNSGVLTLAGIIVMYTLLVSTLNTAHDGEVLGKEWRSMWVPLRTVGGIALLIPKASGYSLIQIFMMWVVVQGIGLADSIWGAAVDYYAGGGVNIQQITSPLNFGSGSGSSATGPVANASDILRSLTCMYVLQNEMQLYVQSLATNVPPIVYPPVPNLYNTITQQYTTQFSSTSSQGSGSIMFPGPLSSYGSQYAAIRGGECGSVSWNTVSLPGWMYQGGSSSNNAQPLPQYAGLPSQIATTRFTAIQTMIASLAGPAQTIANNYVIYNGQVNGVSPNSATPLGAQQNGAWVNPTGSGQAPLMNANVIMNPSAAYIAQFKNLMSQLSLSQSSTSFNTQLATQLKAGGWGLAGAALGTLMSQSNTAANLNTTVSQITTAGGPQAGLDKNQNFTRFFGDDGTDYLSAIDNLVNGTTDDYSVGPGGPFMSGAGSYSGTFSASAPVTPSGSGNPGFNSGVNAVFNPLGGIADAIDGLQNAQNNNANPIILASSLGSLIINFFMDIWILGTIVITLLTVPLALIPSINFSNIINTPLQWVMSFITPFIVILLTCGFTLCFYLPLIPYILFTLGVIGWLVTVLEAMCAAPLIAIGIAHPEGAHAVVGKAEPAIGLLVHVFLRPTLMIIGLLGGISLAYVGVWLVNYGFSEAWNFASQQATGFTGIFTQISKIVIYTVMVVTVMQLSFSLIYKIPDGVFKWIGVSAGGSGFEEAGEGKIAAGYGQFASGAAGVIKGKVDSTLKDANKLANMKGGGGGMGGGGGGGNLMSAGDSGGGDTGGNMMSGAGGMTGSTGGGGGGDSGGGGGGDMSDKGLDMIANNPIAAAGVSAITGIPPDQVQMMAKAAKTFKKSQGSQKGGKGGKGGQTSTSEQTSSGDDSSGPTDEGMGGMENISGDVFK